MSDEQPHARFGWFSAVGRSILVAVVGVGFAVVVPNLILTSLTSTSRSTRVGLAVACFAVSMACIAVALRRLQARRWL